ncbi:hypothetical protein KI387_009927 [Taxus chinensis]|uniref:Pectinesterase n=1 Tax=Taxus chinensis TaxID=29808 RepID=A0AA38KE65_TAXCH|nr:hypothetical protein KI387_009927 [Taxus chinensis]
MKCFHCFVLVLAMVNVGTCKTTAELEKSVCNMTLYPDICVSTLTSGHIQAVFASGSHQDPAKISVMATLIQVQELSALASRISGQSMAGKESVALSDCTELFQFTTEQVNESYSILNTLNSESVKRRLSDLQTWLSASLTNLRTCTDGFQNSNGTLKILLYHNVQSVSFLVSNSLAIVNTISLSESMETRQDLSHQRRHLLSDQKGISRSMKQGFPAWMSAEDRRLLQSPNGDIQVDAIVAQDGTGNYNSIAAALNAAPQKSTQRYVIYIKAGVYEEKLTVYKENIMLLGDGKGVTVVTGSSSLTKEATQFAANFMASSNGFIARDMTFENTAGPEKGPAAALLVRSDRCAFYRCSVVGYQDTLYAHSQRQFYRECDIYGTVDFIFGNAAAVFQACNLIARKPLNGQSNVITAQGRGDPNENTGFSMHNCKVIAAADLMLVKKSVRTLLGRPWLKFSRTVYMQCFLDDLVDPSGWMEWDGNLGLKTLYYAEYMNTGPGSGTAQRVKWPGYRVLKTAAEANQFTVNEFIYGNSWLPSTGVAYQGGLIL